MKFLESHRQPILRAIEEAGYTKEDFHWVKRKGRILTMHRHSDAVFSHFRRKEVQLNLETQSFDKSEYFEIRMNNGSVLKVGTWSEVMKHFVKWLKGIQK